MTVATQSINRAPRPSSLADVLEVVLDKGIVIDAYVRVALLGIELITIDARIVIASVDTYLRFAEAVNRLDLQPDGQVSGLPGMIKEITGGDEDGQDEQEQEEPRPRQRRPANKTAARRTGSGV
jgi:gas vesicle structural protein